MTTLSGIYVILDGELMPDIPSMLDISLQAGVRLFQYRDKRGADLTLLQMLHQRTQTAGATLIVNDALELAEFADGLHLGQTDLELHTIADARARLGHKILGVSAHTPEQARRAHLADYLGVGPLHATQSKQVARPALELHGVVDVARSTELPICAIGGIDLQDIQGLRKANIAMAAVIGALAKAANPVHAVQTLVEAWNH